MKFILYITAFVLLCADVSFSQIIKDPIQDFLFTQNINITSSLPQLKNLYILQCRMSQTGQPATLVSFNGLSGKQGNIWTAYIPVNDGYVKADDNTDFGFIFRQDAFYIGFIDNQYGLLAYAPGKGAGDLNLFQLVNGKITERNIGSLNLSVPKDQQEFDNYFGKAPDWKSKKKYPIKILGLDELRKAGYDVDLAIKEANKAIHPVPTASPLAVQSPSGSQFTSVPIQQPTSTSVVKIKTPQSFPWPWIVGAILLLLGGGFLFLHKKSRG